MHVLLGRHNLGQFTIYEIEGLVRTKKYSGQTFANLEYSYDLNQRLAWRKFWSDAVNSKQTIYLVQLREIWVGEEYHIGDHIV